MANIPNQNNFLDEQNFEIDIDKLYSDFIQEIDSNRSIVNTANQGNQTFLKVLKEQTITNLAKLVKVEQTPQESRCHAFFRMIGFPVISKDLRHYNPGFDIIKDPNRKVKLGLKIDIANNPFDGFNTLSFKRENYVNSILQTFSKNESITASALALSSSTNIRNFSGPTFNLEPFDMDPVSQSYTANFKAQIGHNNNISLKEYKDEFGNTPNTSQLNQTRFHIIKPFIVDPKIDFTVAPARNRIAVPFSINKTNLLVSENTFVKRPLLEKVIRDRFAVNNDDNIGSSAESIKNYILNTPGVKDEQLIRQMTSDVYNLSEQQQFKKYLNVIRVMCQKLVEAQLNIQALQSLYYWTPIPSIIGPEGGCSIKNVIISNDFPSDYLTTFDKALINNILKQNSNQINIQSASAAGIPDVGGFAFDNFKTTFDSETSVALGDVITETVNKSVKNRNQYMKSGGQALRIIEIIMGEFSGLGFCDIIAVMGALYIMPKEDLLGFLDEDAFDRMKNTVDYISDDIPYPSITTAMISFLDRVSDYYNLMDKIYQDLMENNGQP